MTAINQCYYMNSPWCSCFSQHLVVHAVINYDLLGLSMCCSSFLKLKYDF